VWNPALSLPPKEFEFSDPELARITVANPYVGRVRANADRRWLQPLVEMLSRRNRSSEK